MKRDQRWERRQCRNYDVISDSSPGAQVKRDEDFHSYSFSSLAWLLAWTLFSAGWPPPSLADPEVVEPDSLPEDEELESLSLPLELLSDDVDWRRC